MRPNYLFPYKSRYLGIALILLHIPVRLIWEMANPGIDSHRLPVKGNDSILFTNEHLFFLASSVLVLIGLFLIAFSKEKIEDEQIYQLRLDSLRWAIYFNYLVLLFSLLFTNGINFIDMLRLNLWLPLLFFIIRFRWVIFRLNRSLNLEKSSHEE
ncbi:MAG TPA: hypothetical protein VK543_08175 [Puia sp.]|nr:hypothetical protein [Puia sp.]